MKNYPPESWPDYQLAYFAGLLSFGISLESLPQLINVEDDATDLQRWRTVVIRLRDHVSDASWNVCLAHCSKIFRSPEKEIA